MRRRSPAWPLPAAGSLLLLALAAGCATERPHARDHDAGRIVADTGGPLLFAPGDERGYAGDPADLDLAGFFAAAGSDVQHWTQHVQVLSDPWFEGRAGGTPGFERATEYVAFHFDRAGLRPAFAGDAWTQPFGYPSREVERTYALDGAELAIDGRARVAGRDFVVLAQSQGATVEGPAVFVGYGIAEGPDGYTSFDDGASLDGAVALLLRWEPLDDEGGSRWAERRFSPRARMAEKLRAVRDRGAAAIVVVAPPDVRDGDPTLPDLDASSAFGGGIGVPVVQATPAVAEAILGGDLADWRRRADAGAVGLAPLGTRLRVGGDVVVETLRAEWPSANVAGVLPGRGALADEWIVVGGHYDHLGHGRPGSRDAAPEGKLHPGADDNASGTASVILLARRLAERAASGSGPRRSILFVAFGAEEAGLHGSAHLVAESPIPLEATTLMVNLDMVGRLRDETVMLGGTGTAAEFDALLPPLVAASGLTVRATPGGMGPSDHASFYRAGIPVLFFFTGLHDDYHMPSDEGWTVNPVGGVRIVDLAESVIDAVARRSAALTPRRDDSRPAPSGDGPRTGASVRFGIMPDYAADLDTGVAVAGVSEGTSAADAGLRAGDVLLTWNGEELTGGQSLANVLREAAPGDVVRVEVRRDGRTLLLDVTLKAR